MVCGTLRVKNLQGTKVENALVAYPFSTYSAFYVGAKEIALTFDDAPLPGSKLMSGTEKTTLRDENEALRY